MTSNSDTARTEHALSTAIVVGTDGSPAATDAVRWAAKTAAIRNRSLHIVHGLGLGATSGGHANPYLTVPGVVDSLEAVGKAVLREAEETARTVVPDLVVETALSALGPTQLLVDLSREAYMVVVGGSTTRFGSIDVAVTSHAHGEVVVVRGDWEARAASAPVVVGIDGSPTSEHAIAAAFEEASWRGAPLVAVHAWSDFTLGAIAGRPGVLTSLAGIEEAENVVLAERLAGWQEKFPDVTIERKVYFDGPREHLSNWSAQAQLVVVGSRGRGGIRGMLLGSTSNVLVRQAHCPVLVVRAPHRVG
ncbi:universal stress protein [Antrihabitans sp. YC2-6]|uniref:universal stress protein n=1 Tax=Antrihabitans sp. YC2-6 TaxID=2799498 RepID=UPI0018F660CC|nr:universal stress protein [Antrihabitans sp. YC2-6]MBJ8346997.1 universal stress protein [Antrihabitans sp. YC2-6]